jgi:mRNA-degrading endonuclease toxin of MazEF toxin-antitoxin module
VARILRGEIRWADLTQSAGANRLVRYPLSLELRAAKLSKRSWAKIHQIRTLSTKRLGKRLGRASEEELTKVVEGLLEIVR